MDISEQGIDIDARRRYLYTLVLAIYRVTDKLPRDEVLRMRMREEAINILSHVEHIYAGNEPARYNKFVNAIQTLVHYCEIAGKQKWVNSANFLVLKHELFKLRNSFEIPAEVKPLPQLIDKAEHKIEHQKHTCSEELKEEIIPEVEIRLSTRDFTELKSPNVNLAVSNTLADNEDSRFKPKIKRSVVRESGNLISRQEIILTHLREKGSAQVTGLLSSLPEVSTRTIRRDLDKLMKANMVKKFGKTNGAQYHLV